MVTGVTLGHALSRYVTRDIRDFLPFALPLLTNAGLFADIGAAGFILLGDFASGARHHLRRGAGFGHDFQNCSQVGAAHDAPPHR